METLSPQIFQEFGIKVKKIKKEKAYYLCETTNGIKAIEKNFDSKERIIFQHKIKEQLYRNNFKNTDRFYISAKKLPFVEYDGNIYTMKNYINYPNIDFSIDSNLEELVKTIANFHKLSQKFEYNKNSYYGNNNIIESFKKDLAELISIKRKIGFQNKFSDFDIIFLKNYDFFKNQLEDSIKLLEESNICFYMKKSNENFQICHNLLKSENLFIHEKEVYIKNFSKAVIGYAMFDLVSIITRYIKNKSQKILNVRDIFEIYSKHGDAENEELKIIYPLLKYPSKFISISFIYYSKKRTWTPAMLMNRMERTISNRDDYYSYIENAN